MARLKKERQASVMLGDEEVTFTFREPTDEELSKFLSGRYNLKIKGQQELKDTSVMARRDFFDLLLTGVDNLEDAEGNEITPSRCTEIPLQWKNGVILRLFEGQEINVKN